VEYHGLANADWWRRCLLVRPQLNGDTLDSRGMKRSRELEIRARAALAA
jgi:hypothetical protein